MVEGVGVVRLPSEISERVHSFAEVHRGMQRVTVVLADGRRFRGVEVAWGCEILAVAGFETIPFSGDDVTEVYDESQVAHLGTPLAPTP
jgi:hypothetical protein